MADFQFFPSKISRRLALALILAVLVAPAAAAPQKGAASGRPDWRAIEMVVDAYFSTVPNWHRGAIISQSDVKPLWALLAKAGWTVADQDKLTKLVPKDDDFLVKQLRTDGGRRFMRTTAVKYSEIYDRLDRLTKETGGKPSVTRLINGAEGPPTIDFMMSKDGSKMWANVSRDPKTFNRPTGRLYTVEQLKARLKAEFAGS